MKQLLFPITKNDHVFGDPNAPIELIEYGDYECPYCGLAYPIIKDIQHRLDSDLLFVFRNFPLTRVHPHAFPAAVASEAAALQDKFWEMHDSIYEHQKTLDEETVLLFARRIGLDIPRFLNDIQKNELAEKVEADFESGIRNGVNRTPTFFVNDIKYEGEWTDGQLLRYLNNLSFVTK